MGFPNPPANEIVDVLTDEQQLQLSQLSGQNFHFAFVKFFLLNFSVIFVQPSSNLEMWRGQVQCFYNLQKSGGVINCKVILWTDTYLHTFLDLSTRRQKVRILLQFVFCYLCFEHYLKKSTALYKTRDLRITWTLFVVSSF